MIMRLVTAGSAGFGDAGSNVKSKYVFKSRVVLTALNGFDTVPARCLLPQSNLFPRIRTIFFSTKDLISFYLLVVPLQENLTNA